MRKVQPPPQYDWPVWVGVSLICPLLALCSLYLAGDYFTLLCMPRAPDFCSQNILKANFVCLGPALLILSIEGNKKLFFPPGCAATFCNPHRQVLPLPDAAIAAHRKYADSGFTFHPF